MLRFVNVFIQKYKNLVVSRTKKLKKNKFSMVKCWIHHNFQKTQTVISIKFGP